MALEYLLNISSMFISYKVMEHSESVLAYVFHVKEYPYSHTE